MLQRFIQWLKSLFSSKATVEAPVSSTKTAAKNHINYVDFKFKAGDYSRNQKIRNVLKHLRIARATIGYEQEVHIAKAKKLIERYNFPPLIMQ